MVAADLARRMLPPSPVLATCADLARLPFRDGVFDLVVAGFSLSHVPEPARAVDELHRVGAALVASNGEGLVVEAPLI